jgi:hypothetical protein
MASETTELLTTLGRLAASTSKIDESVQRIASALEQTLNSRYSPLTNDEKDEEIAFLKKYIKMKDIFIVSVKVCIILINYRVSTANCLRIRESVNVKFHAIHSYQ